MLRPGSDLLAMGFLSGRDTLSLGDWAFTASSSDVVVTGATPLTLTA
jgi:hypothetical protein